VLDFSGTTVADHGTCRLAVEGPTNTDSAANASRSLTSSRLWLQPMTARIVRCLGS
jgi:hypothetical protein